MAKRLQRDAGPRRVARTAQHAAHRPSGAAIRQLLKTCSAHMNDYHQFAGSVLWQLPGLRETRTYAVMEEVKNSTHLCLT